MFQWNKFITFWDVIIVVLFYLLKNVHIAFWGLEIAQFLKVLRFVLFTIRLLIIDVGRARRVLWNNVLIFYRLWFVKRFTLLRFSINELMFFLSSIFLIFLLLWWLKILKRWWCLLLVLARLVESLVLSAEINALFYVNLVVVGLHLFVEVGLFIWHYLLKTFFNFIINSINYFINFVYFFVYLFNMLPNGVSLQEHLLE